LLIYWYDSNERVIAGFPAGSLPRRRFLPSGVRKTMIKHSFLCRVRQEKIFSRVFPVRQGTSL
jgi:hypothetical protein